MAKLSLNNVTLAQEIDGVAHIDSATSFPAGHVIQVNTQGIRTTVFYTTSSSTLQIAPETGYARITPKQSGSKFVIQSMCNVNSSDDENGGDVNGYRHGFVERSINGGSFVNADMLGVDNNQGGVPCHIELSPDRVDTSYTGSGHRYRTTIRTSTIIDEPTYSLGDYIDYRLMLVLKNGSAVIQIGQPLGYSTDDAYCVQPWGFTIMEVAQ